MSRISQLRHGLWHLKKGGFKGVTRWYQKRVPHSQTASSKWNVARFISINKKSKLKFASMQSIVKIKPNFDINVGVILDDFSRSAFSYEWNQICLTRNNWSTILAEEKIDVLFVESAWAGNEGEWKFHLTGANGPSLEFQSLVVECRDRGIPTVFWNKEDPPHYEDFLDAARLFDQVFTSDSRLIPRYQEDLGHDRLDSLSFAAQPALHNPIRPVDGWRSRDFAFAGMYFAHKYVERKSQMDFLLRAAIDAVPQAVYGLEIFSRMLGAEKKYQFPDDLAKRVVGSLTYPEMLTAYKAYKVFLNVNSVVNSPSMCARRIFEIMACGTPILSTPSVAIQKFFADDEIFVAADAEQTRETLRALYRNPELGDRAVHRAQRRIWKYHTYEQRVESIVNSVGLDVPHNKTDVEVSCIVSTNRPDELSNILNQFSRQTFERKQLVLMLHGFETDRDLLEGQLREKGIDNSQILVESSSTSLGNCLNRLVDASDGSVLSKMDDDDSYGSNYLEDMVNSLGFSNADLVGKSAHYMYVEQMNALILRFSKNEHKFVSHVMGPTITGSKSVFVSNRFHDLQRGEDTAFLHDVRRSGGKIYGTDRFNFVQNRNGAGHTWNVTDLSMLATGDIKLFGDFSGEVYL